MSQKVAIRQSAGPIPPVEQKLCLMEPIRLTKRWSEPPPGACSHFR